LSAGYWVTVGTIRRYHEASLTLSGDAPPFSFHSPEGVIYTRMRNLPASRVASATTQQCIISDGCTIRPGAHLDRCLLGVRSRIGAGVTIKDSIVIGADGFETDQDRVKNRERGVPDIGIGDNAIIERAIIDKDCRIGNN